MSALSIASIPGGVVVSNGDVAIAEYRVNAAIEPVNTPKPFLHPLRTLGGVEVTAFGREDHPWHHGLQVAFPRVGGHNLWGGGTYFGPEEDYRVVDDQGSIRHEAWQDAATTDGTATIAHAVSWWGHRGERLLTENRSWILRTAGDALVIDLATVLRNATAGPLEVATPAQRGRPDGGYGGLFLRLGLNFTADALFGGDEPVTGSGHVSRTLVVHGRTGNDELVTLGLSYLPGSAGAERWLYRFGLFAAIGWAVAYEDGFELPVDGELALRHRLVLLDGHVERGVVEGLL